MTANMKPAALGALLGAAVSAAVYRVSSIGLFLSLAITFGTVGYHFAMRLLVGWLFQRTMHNRADAALRWFRVPEWEQRLYRKLRVKSWKNRLPTYDTAAFDPRYHSWEEILGAACQAELVHEVIILLSFLPILAARWFGALPVFIITSTAAACFDLLFVILQRYNRPRILKFLRKKERK